MKIILFLGIIFNTIFSYELGYKRGRLDELEENLKTMNEALFVNKEPQDLLVMGI